MKTFGLLSVILGLYAAKAMAKTRTFGKRADTIFLPGGNFPSGTKRTETQWTSTSPDTDVITSVISVLIPLPSDFPSHSVECDYLSYLRYRYVQGPSNSAQADRILSVMPGTLAGASSFDQLARNIVLDAKTRYQLNVEVWALDRRSNCLDDQTGVLAALQSKNVTQAIGYYYNGSTINGRTFKGYLNNSDIAFVGKMGMEQTVKDWYDLVISEIPDVTYRATKHFIGGHSLGGTITAFFAMHDADGEANTTSDAGYNQAAGFIAYDTTITPSMGNATSSNENPLTSIFSSIIGTLLDIGYDALDLLYQSGLAPRTLCSSPVLLNAEVFTALSTLGASTVLDPTGSASFDILPKNFNINASVQIFNSKTYMNFFNFTPSAFSFKYTNQAALGSLLSDTTNFISILQLSVGFFKGSPVVEKSFPYSFTSELASNPSVKQILSTIGGTRALAIPDSTEVPYGWLNYDEIAADGSNIAKDNAGQPFTNASSEVTDINELALALSTPPLDFAEKYYPTKLTTDLGFITNGTTTTVVPSALHSDGYTKRPILTFFTGEGPIISQALPYMTPGTYTVLPGYNHLDCILAARKQNNGQPEVVTTKTTDFISKLGSGALP